MQEEVQESPEANSLKEQYGGMDTDTREWADKLVENEYYYRRQLHDQFKDPRRDIYEDCGYTKTQNITPEKLTDFYQRFSIATRVVDLPVDESWRKTPKVQEYGTKDNEETQFEKEWRNLDSSLSGEKSWFKTEEGSPIWAYLKRVDRLSRIGQYGVMLMEFDDVGKPKENGEDSDTITWADPIPGFEDIDEKGYLALNAEETKDKIKKSGLQLIGLRTFDQEHAEVQQWNDFTEGPMFGRPMTYKITIGDLETTTKNQTKGLRERQVDVHWSRIIHVADGLTNSEYIGTPACRPVLNDLMDLQKIYAASGEGYWRTAFPGLSFETHPSLGGKAKLDTENIKKQMQKFQHTFQRYLATAGGTIKSISGTVTALGDHVEDRIEAICIYMGCPVRIFKGSERGELASSQDKDSWDERMILRQVTYITPSIIAPFVNRLIAAGVLSEPKEGFEIIWPDLSALSKTTKMQLANQVAEALSKYVSAGLDQLISPHDFFVKVLEFESETVDEMLQSAVEHTNLANPDADDITEPGTTIVPPELKDEEGDEDMEDDKDGKDKEDDKDDNKA